MTACLSCQMWHKMKQCDTFAPLRIPYAPPLQKKSEPKADWSLTDFIWKEKTEEAKRLLRYSDKSFSSIGTYLWFSSPAHFSQVFKKYTGKTPSEYRGKYH